MSRKQKDTVDYFPHFVCDEDTQDVLNVLESSYGATGYAFYYKLFERLATTDGHCYEYRDKKKHLLASRLGVPVRTCDEILSLLADWGTIDKELFEKHSFIWSQDFVDNIADVYANRRREAPKKPFYSYSTSSLQVDIPISTCNNAITTGKSTQSKVKESKVNKSKVEESKLKETKVEPTTTYSNFSILLKDNKEFVLPEEYVLDWETVFPNTNVRRSIKSFADFSHKLGKDSKFTLDNVIKAIENWLKKESGKRGHIAVISNPSNIYVPKELTGER